MDEFHLTAEWPAPARVRTLMTTRRGGGSGAPYNSNNLAMHVGDSPSAVAHNRAQLQQLVGNTTSIHWLRQTHSTDLVQACDPDEVPAADGCLTSAPRRACAVLTADCLPILLCNQQGTQVAAVHAGWRGLAQGILVKALEQFSAGDEVLVYLGPAISQRHFEVGPEVKQSFSSEGKVAGLGGEYQEEIEAAFAASDQPGHWYANLYQLARAQCRALGVHAVFGGGHCTFEENQLFYSYRRDGETGRMASLIWLA